jgi:ribonuclease P/MRP protein subunit RPP1
VRATRGRGLVVSSEARSVLGVRAPADVENLLAVWGVSGDQAKETVTVTPRSVVANEGLRRRGFRGIIDVVDGGEIEENTIEKKQHGSGDWNKNVRGKKDRKETIDSEDSQDIPLISKRQAKRMRLASREGDSSVSTNAAQLNTQNKAKNQSKT